MSKANPTKEEKIQYFLEKGPEWMANQLWIQRKQNKEMCEDRNREYQRAIKAGCKVSALEKANRNLAEVIGKNGIRPVRYIMSYIVPCYEDKEEMDDTEECEARIWDIHECDDCEDRKERTESVCFYGFSIEDGWLNGIDEEFSDISCSVFELRNESTGAVIYKRKGKKSAR